MKQVSIDRLLYSPKIPKMMGIVLKDRQSNRFIHLFARFAEGYDVIQALSPLLRTPLQTHDLMTTVLDRLAGAVTHVIITEMQDADQTVYATIVLEAGGVTHEIEARAIDALSLAVRAQVPILARESILNWAKAQDFSEFGPFSTLWPL